MTKSNMMSKPRWKMKETNGSPAPKLKKWRGSPAPKIYAKVTISKAMNVQMENDKRRYNTNNDKTQKTTDKKTNKNKKRTAWKGFKQIHQDRLLDCLLYAKGLSPGHDMGSHFLETFLLGCSLLCASALPKDVDFTWFQWKKKLPPRFCWGSVWFFLNKQPLFGSLASFQILDRFQSDVFSAHHESWGWTFWGKFPNADENMVNVLDLLASL